MKRWIVKGVLVVVAVAAFPLAVYLVLLVQGRLTSPDIEALRQLPVVGGMLPAAVEEEPEETAPEVPTPDVPSGAEGAEEAAKIRSAETPEHLVEELRARRAFFDRRIEELDASRTDLERQRLELEDRERILKQMEERLDLKLADIRQAKKALEQQGRMIAANEARTYKATAKAIAEMDSTVAAEALSDLDDERAARILRVMDATSVGSIFSEMRDPERRKALLDLYTRLHMQDAADGR
jgi:flagellar motility protein MotE (MotC chaperone)